MMHLRETHHRRKPELASVDQFESSATSEPVPGEFPLQPPLEVETGRDNASSNCTC